MAKKNLKCVVCEALLSKDEAEIVDENTFTLLEKWPSGIKVGVHCFACFEAHVRADVDAYNEKVERAKNVNVFYATQSKESRFVRRVGRPIEVKDCADRDEVVLRLAFKAVEANKNTLVDVDFSSTKVVNGRWQTTVWAGKGLVAQVDEADLNRKYIGTPN